MVKIEISNDNVVVTYDSITYKYKYVPNQIKFEIAKHFARNYPRYHEDFLELLKNNSVEQAEELLLRNWVTNIKTQQIYNERQ